MRLYSATVELRTAESSHEVAAHLMETLGGYEISVLFLDNDWISARLRLVGSSLAQATQTATEVIGRVSGQEPLVCHVMEEAEYERRTLLSPLSGENVA